MRWIGHKGKEGDEGPPPQASQAPPPPAPAEASPRVVDVTPIQERIEPSTPPDEAPRAFTEAPRPREVAPLVPVRAPKPVFVRRREPHLIPESTPPDSFEQELLTTLRTINRLLFSGIYETDPDLEDLAIHYLDHALIMLFSQNADYSFEASESYLLSKRHLYGDERYVGWAYGELGNLWRMRGRSFEEDKIDDVGYATELAPVVQYMGTELQEYLISKASGEEILKPRLPELAGMMYKNNTKSGQTLVAIDSSRKLEGGVTGVGKSSLAAVLALSVVHQHQGMIFHIANHIVYGHDSERMLYFYEKGRTRFQPYVIDESELFFDKRRSQSEETRSAGLRMFTGRFYNQYWFFAGPSIHYYDERLSYGQIQYRYHIVKKPDFDNARPKMLVEVYSWNGHMDEDEDEWGELMNKFWVDMLPRKVYRFYEQAKILIGEFGSYNEAKKKSDEFANLIRRINWVLEESHKANEETKAKGVRGLMSEIERGKPYNPREGVRVPAPTEVRSRRSEET